MIFDGEIEHIEGGIPARGYVAWHDPDAETKFLKFGSPMREEDGQGVLNGICERPKLYMHS